MLTALRFRLSLEPVESLDLIDLSSPTGKQTQPETLIEASSFRANLSGGELGIGSSNVMLLSPESPTWPEQTAGTSSLEELSPASTPLHRIRAKRR